MKLSKRLLSFGILFLILFAYTLYTFLVGDALFVVSMPITTMTFGIVLATIERDYFNKNKKK